MDAPAQGGLNAGRARSTRRDSQLGRLRAALVWQRHNRGFKALTSLSHPPASPEATDGGRSEPPVVVYAAASGAAARLAEAGQDVLWAIRNPGLWLEIALQDVKGRYRGSLLGPWWITISMAALIGGMSLLYSRLMHLSLAEYVPWMCCGIVLWGFLSMTIQEGCDALVSAAPILRQTPIPTLVFFLRTICRNLIVLAHNLVIVAVMSAIFGLWRHARLLEFLGGVVAAVLVLVALVAIVSIVSARFRDVPQIVTAILQVLLFMTPVFWRADQLPGETKFLLANPAFHLIEVMRAPLIGGPTPVQSWAFVAVFGLALWAGAALLYAAARRRIVHFL